MAKLKIKQGDVTFDMFFNRDAVIKRTTEKGRIVLAKTGKGGMTTIRRSMRQRGQFGKPSTDGNPPKAVNRTLRDNIFFGLDTTSNSLVIGPLTKSTRGNKYRQNIPLILEQGGVVRRAVVRVVDKRVKVRRKKDRKYTYITKDLLIKARPYVGPGSINYPKIMTQFEQHLARTGLT